MLDYTQFDHTKLIGVPYTVVPPSKVKHSIIGLSDKPDYTPEVADDEVLAVYDYKTIDRTLNCDNYWLYAVVTDCTTMVSGKKGLSKRNLVGKVFYCTPGSRSYDYLIKGYTDLAYQSGNLLDGTYFSTSCASVQAIKFI